MVSFYFKIRPITGKYWLKAWPVAYAVLFQFVIKTHNVFATIIFTHAFQIKDSQKFISSMSS